MTSRSTHAHERNTYSTVSGGIGKTRILVIEDDLALQIILISILRRVSENIEIAWTDTAEKAFIKVKEKHYDLVIADIFLKGRTTGIEFWQVMEIERPEIPLVVMSGLPYNEFLIAIGRNNIAPPFLSKPLNPGEAVQILKGILISSQRYAFLTAL